MQGKGEFINSTSAFCKKCNQSHSAQVIREENDIIFVVDCPEGKRESLISSNANMFLKYRARSSISVSATSPERDMKWSYIVEVTNACNYCCPVCFNSCGESDSSWMLSTTEAKKLAAQLKKRHGKSVVLSGGEPFCHPDLPELVEIFSSKGFRTTIATNGHKISEDPDILQVLKKKGLYMLLLQFDTLNDTICHKIRGGKLVAIKKKAVDAMVELGVRCGLTCTVTSLNVMEAGELLRYCVTKSPWLKILNFQIAFPVGRYLLPSDTVVDREAVIEALENSQLFSHSISWENFWPHPVFKPWNSEVHPDCSANLILLTSKNGVTPIDSLVNQNGLYKRLYQNKMRSNFFTKNIVPLYYILRETPPSRWLSLASHFFGFMTGYTSKNIILVAVNNVMDPDCIDENRIARCALELITRNGSSSPCCCHGAPKIHNCTTPTEVTGK
ncbi:MAG: radical SAM protein [Planctomycetes bacterium]|nr:radical SAM protein [Planctomycetota bacterium]